MKALVSTRALGSSGEARSAEPKTAAELVEVLDDMRAVLGPPEAMESPRSRAIYLLNQSRLIAAAGR
jgi:hypothetical protein